MSLTVGGLSLDSEASEDRRQRNIGGIDNDLRPLLQSLEPPYHELCTSVS